MKELTTIGIAKSDEEVEALVKRGQEWIDREQQRRHPRLDLLGEERIRFETYERRTSIEQHNQHCH